MILKLFDLQTSYLPFMSQSDQASYVFAFDVKLAGKHALQHVMSMLNVINGQVSNIYCPYSSHTLYYYMVVYVTSTKISHQL